MKKVTAYKVDTLANLKPNAIVALKTAGENTFSLYVTDLQGVPHSLNLPATTGVQQIINTDGALQVVGSTNVVINLEPAILASINSALQVGDNISELTNDVGYITDLEEKVVNEIPTGVLNGVNSTFTTQFGVKPDSEEVYVNGNRQKKTDDYNISGQIINLTFSPQSTESILIDYIKL